MCRIELFHSVVCMTDYVITFISYKVSHFLIFLLNEWDKLMKKWTQIYQQIITLIL